MAPAGPVGPADVAEKIAEVVLGKPADKSKPFAGNAADYAGSYAGPGRGRAMDVTIGADAGKLTIKMGERDSVRTLSYYEGDTFGRNESRFTFVRTNGKVTGLRADLVYGYSILKKK